jgi:hypothetical protein
LVGLFAVTAGLWGMFCWFSDLAIVLKGALPVMVVMGGMVAIIAGISAIRRPPGSGGGQ